MRTWGLQWLTCTQSVDAWIFAVSIFNKMPFKKVSWNAVINGFALHGHGRQAIECFDSMFA